MLLSPVGDITSQFTLSGLSIHTCICTFGSSSDNSSSIYPSLPLNSITPDVWVCVLPSFPTPETIQIPLSKNRVFLKLNVVIATDSLLPYDVLNTIGILSSNALFIAYSVATYNAAFV